MRKNKKLINHRGRKLSMDKPKKELKKKNLYLTISILIPFLMSMFCTFSLGSLALVMALVKETKIEWHVTLIMVGIAMGSMTIGMAISGLIAAYSVDRISKKPVAIIGGLITGLSFILLANSWTWEVFFIAVVLTGIGNGIVAPVIFALISDATPPEKRATNYGLFFLFGLAGTIYVIIFFLPAILVDKNWQGAYYLFGIYIVVLALLIFITKLPSRGQKDRAIQELIEVEGIHYEYAIHIGDLKVIMKRKSNRYLILNFADAIPAGVNTFIIFWLVEEHNLAYSAALGMFVIIVFLVFLTPVFWGIYVDRLQKNTEDETLKIKVCILLLIISSPLGVIAVFIPWDASGITDPFGVFLLPGFVIVFLLLVAIFIFAPGVKPIWQSAITEVNLPEHRTTSYQIAMFVDQLGTALGALVAGFFIVWFNPNGYIAAFVFSALMGIANIFTWVIALRYYREDKLEIENILSKRAKELKEKKI
jgi:MFS family permease